MKDSVKNPGLKAFYDQIAETKRASSTAPIDPPVNQPVVEQPAKTIQTSAKTDNGGGGNGTGNNGGGGNGPGGIPSGGFGGFLNRLNTMQRILFGLVVMILFAVLAQFINLFFLEKTLEYNKKYEAINVVSTQKNPKKNEPNSSVAIAKSDSIIYATSFDCPVGISQNERDILFDSKEVQFLRAGQSLHLPTGCMVIQVDEMVTELKGYGYLFSVSDPSIPGNFFKCGTYSGLNNTPEECKSFLNYHAGRKIRVGVNGGSLVIN